MCSFVSGVKHTVLLVRTDLTFQHAKDKPLEILNWPINAQLITDSSVHAMPASKPFLGIKVFIYIYIAKEKNVHNSALFNLGHITVQA